MNSEPEIWVLLHNIRSTHNVGSIFRTSDAIGVSRIFLTGYTPAPLDRFGRPVKDIAKTALGAELSIPWEQHEDPKSVVENAKAKGFVVLGVEQDPYSIDYKTYHPKERVLLVMGEEVSGISEELRAVCDSIVEIPMRGQKESLNVSVAFGIVMYRLFDR